MTSIDRVVSATDAIAARVHQRARVYRILFWTAIILVFGGLALDLWGWQRAHWSELTAALFGGGLALLGVIVLILAVVFRKKIWLPNPRLDTLRALKAYVRRQFREAQGRARGIDRRIMSVPWNLFIAFQRDPRSTVMAELGYVEFGDPITHKGVTLSTWASPTAIAYRVEVADTAEPSFEALSVILDDLSAHRPSMAVNAAFVEYELDVLMSAGSSAIGNTATLNRIINTACFRFKLDIPVHLMLVGLEHMLDVSRAAFLSGQLSGDTVLGGFLDTGPDEDTSLAVDRLFDTLIANLSNNQFATLQKQLAPDFCTSLVNTPFQLALVKSQLQERLATLTQPLPPRQDRLNLQSVSFVGARRKMSGVDPLSQLVGNRFFSKVPETGRSDALRESVTAKNAGLLAAGYYAEAFGIREDSGLAFRTRARSGFLTFLLVAIVAGYALLVGENYLAHQRVNTQLKTSFEDYYSTIGDLGVTSDTLVDRVLKLSTLRDGLLKYAILEQDSYRDYMPDWSMEYLYRELYETELLEGFQLSLADYLKRDVFAYNALADGVTLVQLASLEAQFFTDQTRYSDELTWYFTSSFAEQGELSSSFQNAFNAVLRDLFALNRPPPERDDELREVVARTLSGLDPADLLYLSLMRRSDYAERQDLRSLIGSRFNQVFEPIQEARVYFVPRAYTGVGFAALFGSKGDIPLLDNLLNNYEAVVGPLDASVRNSITRRIASRYTSDYISHWTNFISALRLRKADGWGDAQILMQALTDPSENPIDRLVDTLKENTDLKVFLPPVPAAEVAPGQPPAPPQEPVVAPATYSAEAGAAASIRTAFRNYVDAATAQGPDGKSQFKLFLEYAQNVTQWLEDAAGAAGGAGPYLFNLYRLDERTTPLSVLAAFSSRSDLEIIRNFGGEIAADLDDAAMGFVFDHINRQWRALIIDPYRAELESSYPFDPASAADMPLDVLTDLFAPEGKIATFQIDFLDQFKARDGGYEARATFLLNGTAQLLDEAVAVFERTAQISDTMFVDGKPYLEFQVRTGFMDNQLSRLHITSGTTLLQFTHGPPRWDQQTWPLGGPKDNEITLRFFRRSRAVFDQSFEGVWSWFRMIDAGAARLNPSQGLAEANYVRDGLGVTLQFDLPKRYNPFVPGFFSGMPLPDTLF